MALSYLSFYERFSVTHCANFEFNGKIERILELSREKSEFFLANQIEIKMNFTIYICKHINVYICTVYVRCTNFTAKRKNGVLRTWKQVL